MENDPRFTALTSRRYIREHILEQRKLLQNREEYYAKKTKRQDYHTEDQHKTNIRDTDRDFAYAELVERSGLDPETATAEQVNNLISKRETSYGFQRQKIPQTFQCDVCQKEFPLVIEFPDLGLGDDRIDAVICPTCLRDAAAFADAAVSRLPHV